MKEHKKIILIVFVAFLLRVYCLGCHDFWYDEMSTIGYTKYPWGNLNAPLYWILLHFWIKLFGISEFTLRFPSLIFSFLSIILVYRLGKSLFNQKVGLFSSLLMSLCPFHLWYAQEARDYSMALFLGTLSSYLFFKIVKEKKNNLWLSFILVSIVGLYTNYFLIFIFIAQGLYIFLSKKLRVGFKNIIYFLIILLGFSFYLPRFLRKFHYISLGFWIPEPGWKSLVITLENFILGYNGSISLYFISNVIVTAFLISAFWVMYKKKDLRQSFAFCLFLFSIPIVCAFFFSKVLFSVYLDRSMIIFSPYFYLILSLGIVSLNRMTKGVLFTTLICLLFVGDYRYFKDLIYLPLEHHTGTYIKKPIRPVAKFLDDNIEPCDIIAFTNESTQPSLRFYIQKELHPFYYFFDPEFPDSKWQRPVQENEYRVPYYEISDLKFKRLWVICSDWARSGELDENSQSVKNWLDENLKLEFVKEFDGLWIFRYIKSDS